jgi:hypothetical protein
MENPTKSHLNRSSSSKNPHHRVASPFGLSRAPGPAPWVVLWAGGRTRARRGHEQSLAREIPGMGEFLDELNYLFYGYQLWVFFVGCCLVGQLCNSLSKLCFWIIITLGI